jgi:hypothetical protein
MKDNFVREIKHLLEQVPAEQWQDPSICGLQYDLLPWHRMSSVTVRVREDDIDDPGGWKYYFSSESDCSLIHDELELYSQTCQTDRLVYHRLLIEAADALLSVDLGKYIPNLTTTYGLGLYKPFQLSVHHADGVFGFNYCEYVLARRLETGEPDAAPDRQGM